MPNVLEAQQAKELRKADVKADDEGPLARIPSDYGDVVSCLNGVGLPVNAAVLKDSVEQVHI